MSANIRGYLSDLIAELKAQWPDNRSINIVCHGHSVPSGYFATPMVDTFNAYPHLLHKSLKEIYPFAVINVIVTAVGGEHSARGAKRFEEDVLCHRPDVVTIDYGLNDRRIGFQEAEVAWRSMIAESLEAKAKVILLTPTPDTSGLKDPAAENWMALQGHASQIRELAGEYDVGLADSMAAIERHSGTSGDITDFLSWSNHPNRKGHEVVAAELVRWFSIT
ncbi:MAG: SGNH/GDSL hydrolase family protein [Planctomycetota bacterium]|jgi:lysophospholipase L1-like esterase|nr:SGNH/GDSL hydrolase family protein [Planctomycetota bacterium]MDP7248972.1 SGNH/GDSL hydrolase family protein [Planctomycetota bacterium]